MSERKPYMGQNRVKAVSNFKRAVCLLEQGYNPCDVSWKLNIRHARVREFIRIYNFYKKELRRIYDYSLSLKDALSNVVNECRESKMKLTHSDYSNRNSIESKYNYVINEYKKGFFIKDISEYTGWGHSFCYLCLQLHRYAPLGYKHNFFNGEWTVSKCAELTRDLKFFLNSQGGKLYGKQKNIDG